MTTNRISATIVADSINEYGNRLTTYVIVFPRMILAELNTHRALSRNSASSRAIPFKTMLKRVEEEPFIPIAFQKDHKGMQGTEYLEGEELAFATEKWLQAKDSAIHHAKQMSDLKVTKQLCNRLLEPFLYHTVIVTGSEWENFFSLRCPQYVTPVGGKDEDGNDWVYRSKKDVMEGHSNEDNLVMMDNFSQEDWLKLNKGQGEIHIMDLAEKMWDAMNESTPKELKAGEWHIPFGDMIDETRVKDLIAPNDGSLVNTILRDTVDYSNVNKLSDIKVKIATARCARVSYLNFEGKDDYEADVKLFNILLGSGHMSPFEHVAKAMTQQEYGHSYLATDGQMPIYGLSGNFKGFIQYRKTLPNENRTV